MSAGAGAEAAAPLACDGAVGGSAGDKAMVNQLSLCVPVGACGFHQMCTACHIWSVPADGQAEGDGDVHGNKRQARQCAAGLGDLISTPRSAQGHNAVLMVATSDNK